MMWNETILEEVRKAVEEGQWPQALDGIAEPLHEALYAGGDFEFIQTLPPLQQVVLCFDYVRQQVLAGGFLQLIENNYAILILPLPQWFLAHRLEEMGQVLDEALQVFLAHREELTKERTVEEFAQLYTTFPHFEALDKRFEEAYLPAVQAIVEAVLEEPK
jgi:hypothetical protein